MDSERELLISQINSLINEEIQNNPVTYNKDRPYQSYERIGFEGLRWSVEKRINEYGLDRFFNIEHNVLDIGSNFGFFVTEFALHCKEVHGIEPNHWLNTIGEITAKYLKVEDRVGFFDVFFDDFVNPIQYDVVLSLAAFFTQDKRERSEAKNYFSKIKSMLNPQGYLFYESTSYTKDKDNSHFVAKLEALDAIKENLELEKEWETPSGSEGFFRQFAIARKK
ncbi:hypothetical protein [Leptospira ilyithenensis]|uniref:Methyltransferase domain-containing protein n=1 Tax=Leptospira ilyithenensis TaxID=2484901 RepID=A0A4R9LM26_9LEPT|nr:hypothetical protein [Leptospira ilyithenensis]TGN08004.1 hypothetical protein EHS11_13785 [Leptospira ilyithenensis]